MVTTVSRHWSSHVLLVTTGSQPRALSARDHSPALPPSSFLFHPSISPSLSSCTLCSQSHGLVLAWSRHITAPGLSRVAAPGHDRITACRPPIPLNSVSSPLARMHGKTPERASARAPTHLHIPLSESSSDKSSVEAPDTRAHAPDAIVHSGPPPHPPSPWLRMTLLSFPQSTLPASLPAALSPLVLARPHFKRTRPHIPSHRPDPKVSKKPGV